MMILSLLAGAALGAISVIFVLQNDTVVTISFFAWQMTGSLAFVLFATLLTGVVVTLLMLLPSFIRDEIYLAQIKRQKREIEDELAKLKSPPTVVVATEV